MEKKHLKIVLTVVLVMLIMATFSACGLLKPRTVEVKEVSIEINSGLTKEGNSYVAYIGDDVVLTAKWNKDANVNIKKEWKLFKGNEEIDSSTEKTFTYSVPIETPDTSSTFTVKLSINGIESSNTITFHIAYAPIRIEDIDSNVSIYNDILQMSRFDYKTVNLEAIYNEDAIDPNVDVSISWKKGDDIESINATYSFTPNDSWDDTTTITLTLTQGETTISKQFSVHLILQYLAVRSVEIDFVSGTNTEALGDSGKQVIQIGPSSPYKPVKLTAVVTPAVGTNTDAEVTWLIRTKSGVSTALETGRELTFIPEYGENIVTCCIENVPSHTFNVVALTNEDYTTKENQLINTFEWEGNVCNRYITDKYDMLALTNYLFANRITTSQTVFYSSAIDYDDFSNYMRDTIIPMIDEAGTVGFTYSSSSFGLTNGCVFGEPTQTTEHDGSVQTKSDTHYSTSTATRVNLPCDSFTKTMEVSNSNQLYRALSNFYKPVITDPTLTALYNKARDVLKDICDDSMTDYEKVLAIYDWIVTEVTYDSVLYAGGGDLSYDGYYLEGVFNNHKAVCDGKAKAFSLLCSIEGIQSIRVSGDALQPKGGSTPSGHAWNKVLIDTPDETGEYDNIKDWFVVDTTWGDRGIRFNGVDTESLSYTYFLISDSDISNSHFESRDDLPQANTVFDFYKVTTVTRNSRSGPLKVTSSEDLGAVLEYYTAKVGTNGSYIIEIEVNMIGVNSETTMKAKITEIMNNPIYYHDPNGRNISQYTIFEPSNMNKDMTDSRSDIYLLYYLIP